MKAKELGRSLQEQEEGGAENAFNPLEKVLLTGGDDCRCRAHGLRTKHCTSRSVLRSKQDLKNLLPAARAGDVSFEEMRGVENGEVIRVGVPKQNG